MTLTERQLEQIVSRVPTPKLERRKKVEPTEAANVVRVVERRDQPTEAVISAATMHNQALAERMTAEGRVKELTELNDPRIRYQRQLDKWQQSVLDAQASLGPHDNPKRGFYDAIARFEREMEER